jgi:hypothetical protein
MTVPPPEDCVPRSHPLWIVRSLVDDVLDRLGGLVAPVGPGTQAGLSRHAVRAVILQILCGMHSDVAMACCVKADIGYRWFIGFRSDEVPWRAEDYAQAKRDVLGVPGFDELLRALTDVLAQRGLLDEAVFAPIGRLQDGLVAPRA